MRRRVKAYARSTLAMKSGSDVFSCIFNDHGHNCKEGVSRCMAQLFGRRTFDRAVVGPIPCWGVDNSALHPSRVGKSSTSLTG